MRAIALHGLPLPEPKRLTLPDEPERQRVRYGLVTPGRMAAMRKQSGRNLRIYFCAIYDVTDDCLEAYDGADGGWVRTARDHEEMSHHAKAWSVGVLWTSVTSYMYYGDVEIR